MRAWTLRLGFVSAFAVGLAGIPACGNKGGGGSGESKPKVAVVSNCTDPFWDICEAGAKKSAADHGVDVVFRQPANLEVALQTPLKVGARVERGQEIARLFLRRADPSLTERFSACFEIGESGTVPVLLGEKI
jgi:hypothetical protein